MRICPRAVTMAARRALPLAQFLCAVDVSTCGIMPTEETFRLQRGVHDLVTGIRPDPELIGQIGERDLAAASIIWMRRRSRLRRWLRAAQAIPSR